MSRFAISLMVLAGALVILILVELFAPTGHGDESALEAGPSGIDPASVHDSADKAAKTVADILTRPLFRGDRRPAPGDGRGNSASQPGDMPRLAGILMSSDANRAIFQPAGKERAIVVVEGETVGSWRVQTIAADAVTLTGPGGTRRLEPKFSSGPGQAAPSQQISPGGPLFGGGAQQNSGPDRLQGKH